MAKVFENGKFLEYGIEKCQLATLPPSVTLETHTLAVALGDAVSVSIVSHTWLSYEKKPCIFGFPSVPKKVNSNSFWLGRENALLFLRVSHPLSLLLFLLA